MKYFLKKIFLKKKKKCRIFDNDDKNRSWRCLNLLCSFHPSVSNTCVCFSISPLPHSLSLLRCNSINQKVDLDEFVGLYSKIKAGEVDGLAGYGLFERRKKK